MMTVWPALLLVLGLIAPCTEAGIACGDIECADNAFCVGPGICRCPEGYQGDPTFQCFPNGYDVFELTGLDNNVTTFYGSKGRIIWPCRFRLTEIKTQRSGFNQTCNFQIFGVNSIVNNRVRLTGVEVFFTLIGPNGNEVSVAVREVINVRRIRVDDNEDKYVLEGYDDGTPCPPITGNGTDPTDGEVSGVSGDLPSDDDDDDDDDGPKIEWGDPIFEELGGGETFRCIVGIDGFDVIEVPSCGVHIHLNGPNIIPGAEENRTTGVVIGVNPDNCDPGCVPPEFPDVNTYVSETPDDDYHTDQAGDKGITLTQQLQHTILSFAAYQDDSDTGDVCDDTAQRYRTVCNSESDQATALENCEFLLADNDTIACIEGANDGTGFGTVSAYKYCLWSYCDPSPTVCSVFYNWIQSCLSLVPKDVIKDTLYCAY